MLSYPISGCQIKINTNGLVKVIEDPRDVYRVPAWEAEDSQGEKKLWKYPDLILIPINGSRIDNIAAGTEQEFVRSEDGEIREYQKYQIQRSLYPSSIFNSSDDDSDEGLEVIGDTLLKNGYIPLFFTMNEIERNNKGYADDGSNFREWKVVEITITGETNYFKSTVDNYFVIGQTAYFQSYFEERNFVGGIRILSEPNEQGLRTTCGLKAIDMVSSRERKIKDKTIKYTGCPYHECSPGQSLPRYSSFIHNTEYCMMDALYTSLYNDNDYFRNKIVQIKNDFLVCIHTRPPGEINSTNYLYLSKEGQAQNGGYLTIKKGYDCQTIVYKGRYLNFGNNPKQPLYCWGKTFQQMLNDNTINFTASGGIKFSGNFAIDKGDLPEASQGLSVSKYMVNRKNESLPLMDNGLNVYPLMTFPICTYFKMNTDSGSDPRNAMFYGNEIDGSLSSIILSTYGEANTKIVKVNNWNQKTVDDCVAFLKASKSKFKVLFINCHGSKQFNTDKSYAILSDADYQSQYFYYSHMKYLLQNRRDDEYYFIYLTPCFGGGLLEKDAKSLTQPLTYTTVDPSQELGGNATICYGDCANSPAWVKPWINGQLYRLASDNTYKNESETVNQLVTQTRKANIEALIDLLKNNYQFMTKYLLDKSKLSWTEQNYNLSTSFIDANNRIIWFSRLMNQQEKEDAIKRFPILFLFFLIDELGTKHILDLNFPDYFKVDDQPISISDFVRGQDYYQKYNKKIKNILKNYLAPKTTRFFVIKFYNNYMDSTKEIFKKYIGFFYDIYKCVCKMDKNSKAIRGLAGQRSGHFNSYYLDDIPGVAYLGGMDNCSFPKFPGFREQDMLNKDGDDILLFSESAFSS